MRLRVRVRTCDGGGGLRVRLQHVVADNRIRCALVTTLARINDAHTHTQSPMDGSIRCVGSLGGGLPLGSMLRAQAAPKPLPVPAHAAPQQSASPTKHEAVWPITD